MRIPNFQNLIAKSSSGSQFLVTSAWFIFQRRLISEVFGDFRNRHAFTIYLYLCKHFDYSTRKTSRCIDTIHKDLKYVTASANNRPKYSSRARNALTWLEKEGFIERVNSHKQQWYRSTILVAPDYHINQKQFYPCGELTFEFEELKEHNQGCIMIPKSAIAESMLADTTLAKRKWTVRKLKTLLLLYAYCWLEYYGGIDPRIVSIDSQGSVKLNPGFCYALKSSPVDVTKTVISLIKDGQFQPVRCLFENGIYMGDVGTYQSSKQTKVIEQIVLRPTHLIKHKVDADVMKMKKGCLIL